MSIGIEIVIILALIVANGVFAMSEIAVVSARKARLQQRVAEGHAGARRALELAESPNRFLSTVQIGITLVGIFTGAFGGATLAEQLAVMLERYEAIAPYAEEIGLGIVVLGIAYLSLVVGELVPKRIGLNAPERIASLLAGPMHALSVLAGPAVTFLTASTDGLLRLLRVQRVDDPPVTEEEIAHLLEAGTQAGVFHEDEQELVERVFWLADQRVSALMTPRHRVVWLDADDPPEVNRRKMFEQRYTRYLVCEKDVDHVVGMVHVRDLWSNIAAGKPFDVRGCTRQPLFVPESTRALRVLELFRAAGIHLAVVVDEYGGVEGIVTLNDVLEEIVGEMTVAGAARQPTITRREDGSWLIDASLAMHDVREALGLEERRADERRDYRTLGGFILARLGRIPNVGDHFDAEGLRFEVVDMDGHRIDKVLIAGDPHAAGEP